MKLEIRLFLHPLAHHYCQTICVKLITTIACTSELMIMSPPQDSSPIQQPQLSSSITASVFHRLAINSINSLHSSLVLTSHPISFQRSLNYFFISLCSPSKIKIFFLGFDNTKSTENS